MTVLAAALVGFYVGPSLDLGFASYGYSQERGNTTTTSSASGPFYGLGVETYNPVNDRFGTGFGIHFGSYNFSGTGKIKIGGNFSFEDDYTHSLSVLRFPAFIRLNVAGSNCASGFTPFFTLGFEFFHPISGMFTWKSDPNDPDTLKESDMDADWILNMAAGASFKTASVNIEPQLLFSWNLTPRPSDWWGYGDPDRESFSAWSLGFNVNFLFEVIK